MLSNPKKLGAVILAVYIFIRYVLTAQLEFLGGYNSYLFEGLFTAVVLYRYRSRFKFKVPFPTSFYAEALGALVLGALTFQVAGWLAIPVPFDFSSTELLVFLIVVGPLLEELLFRQALWFAAEDLLKKPALVIAATAFLFSFGHFYAYFAVPPEVQIFVLYQTVYTVVLGIWWGMRRHTYPGFLPVYLLHLGYNLGFFLGSKF